jgi:hypothetical protein
MQYFGTGRLGAHQSAAYTGTAGTITNAIGDGVNRARVVCTTDAFIVISKSPTATTAGVFMPAGVVEYFTINPGEKVSAIQSSAGGTLHVTEVS